MEVKDIIVGDVHGAYRGLKKLLDKCNYQEKDRLWFVGDLVNRGKSSLEVLRFVQSLGDNAQFVLGNHDIHMLGVYYGVREYSSRDTFSDVLDSRGVDNLMSWLKQKPLAIYHQPLNMLMVHAGVYPGWSVKQTLQFSDEISGYMASKHTAQFLDDMFSNKPKYWHDELSKKKHLRSSLNILTRMRYLYFNPLKNRWSLDHKYKGPLDIRGNFDIEKDRALTPWFQVNTQIIKQTNIVFGHWSALGFYQNNNILGIDGGYLWGGNLNALVIDNNDFATKRRVWINREDQ